MLRPLHVSPIAEAEAGELARRLAALSDLVHLRLLSLVAKTGWRDVRV